MRFVFAGDRQLGVNILSFLISKGYLPLALFVSEIEKASHSNELIEMSGLESERIFVGTEFKSPSAIQLLSSLDLDYIIGIHFPYIVPKEVLGIPKIGFLNLHPAYLPFNKGWHTPTWAILDGTKYGATLHFMGEELDAGDIILQKELNIQPFDTADSLYQKALKLEETVFKESLPLITSLSPPRIPQLTKGTSHTKKELKDVQEIDLEEPVTPMQLVKKLRALTTNNCQEAAYFIENGKKYFVQVHLGKID